MLGYVDYSLTKKKHQVVVVVVFNRCVVCVLKYELCGVSSWIVCVKWLS
jgi:hypothetical protein